MVVYSRIVGKVAIVCGILCAFAVASAPSKGAEPAARPVLTPVPNSFWEGERSPESVLQSFDIRPPYLTKLQQTKPRLKADSVVSFRKQFARLPDGRPVFVFPDGEFFVLLSKEQVNAQAPAARVKIAEADAAKFKDKLGKKETESAAASVDHTAMQTAIRNQGERGTCTAFATCAGMETLLKRSGTTADLCENLAYLVFMKAVGSTPCSDPGIRTVDAPSHLAGKFICADSHWAYISTAPQILQHDGTCATIDVLPPALVGKPGHTIANSVELPRGSEIEANGSFDIRDTKTLEQLLADDHDIVFGTEVAWNSADFATIVDVVLDPTGQPAPSIGGHAMLIVGYNTAGEKPYFIVKNSWGAGKGHSGYLWISYDYIRTYAKYGFVISELATGPVANIP
jgi:hypothetical protein